MNPHKRLGKNSPNLKKYTDTNANAAGYPITIILAQALNLRHFFQLSINFVNPRY